MSVNTAARAPREDAKERVMSLWIDMSLPLFHAAVTSSSPIFKLVGRRATGIRITSNGALPAWDFSRISRGIVVPGTNDIDRVRVAVSAAAAITATALVVLLGGLRASLSGMAHLVAIIALDAGPIFGLKAVSRHVTLLIAVTADDSFWLSTLRFAMT